MEHYQRLLHDDETAVTRDRDFHGAALVGAGFARTNERGGRGLARLQCQGRLLAVELASCFDRRGLDGIAVQGVVAGREVDFHGTGFRRGVDAHIIPLITRAAREDDVLAGVTVDEFDLVPLGGHGLHEIDGPGGGVGEVFRGHGEVLDVALEKHGR